MVVSDLHKSTSMFISFYVTTIKAIFSTSESDACLIDF